MYHIGILQLTQNLDDAVHGFKQGLTKLGLEVTYHYVNADGNLALLPKLAARLETLNVDLIFACSTPAALAANHLEKNIPVVFTPVFDPVGAGLVNKLEKPGGKATGTAGMVKATDKISFIKELLPNAKKIGVIYAIEDSNAKVETANFARAAESVFNIVKLPIEKAEDLSRLPDMLPKDLDAVFLPIGRIIEENFSTINYYTDIYKLPVIASHPPNVSFGALGALTANHKKLGQNCARQAAEILKGINAGDIPVDIIKNPDIVLNTNTASHLSITIPNSLLSNAAEIYE